jgi:Ni,Fe-hydrogenase I cytochrome b subunit
MPPFTEEILQKRVQKKQEAAQIRQFKSQQKVYLMTSRFNTQTKLENQRFREKNWKQGCLYHLQHFFLILGESIKNPRFMPLVGVKFSFFVKEVKLSISREEE